MGGQRRIDAGHIAFLGIALVVEVLYVHVAAVGTKHLAPEGVAQTRGAIFLVDLDIDRGVGRDPENGRRQVAHPIQVRVVGPRPLNRRAHGGDRFEVDAGAGAFESARPLEHEKAHEGYGRDDHGDN